MRADEQCDCSWHVGPHAANHSRHSHDALKRRIERRWSQGAKASAILLNVSAGAWTPAPRCETPRLWLFLAAEYRTFHYTQRAFANMADQSSGGCYFVAAAAPEELCREDSKRINQCAEYWHPSAWTYGRRFVPLQKALDFRQFTSNINDTAMLLQRAQETTFAGHGFAYLVIRRHGTVRNSFSGSLPMFWHAVWALAEWAAAVHNIHASPSSVVIRTRFDAMFDVAFELQRLIDYFAHGTRGEHLVIGQEWEWVQSTELTITSFGCYSNDIGRALEEGASIGYHNMGMGHSIMWNSMPAPPSNNSVADGVETPSWVWVRRRTDFGNGTDGGWWQCMKTTDSTSHGPCLVTVVESPFRIDYKTHLLRHAGHGEAFLEMTSNSSRPPLARLDLSSAVHVYCPRPPGPAFPSHVFAGRGVNDDHRYYRLSTPRHLTVDRPSIDVWPVSCEQQPSSASQPSPTPPTLFPCGNQLYDTSNSSLWYAGCWSREPCGMRSHSHPSGEHRVAHAHATLTLE